MSSKLISSNLLQCLKARGYGLCNEQGEDMARSYRIG